MEAPLGRRGTHFQAPIWNFAGGQRATISGSIAKLSGWKTNLVLLIATADCYVFIGPEDSAAPGDNANSTILPANLPFPVGIQADHTIHVIQVSAGGVLHAIPA